MANALRVKWTREHYLVALNVYCKLPFGQLHKGNRLIVDIAKKMGRTPSSLAMKLCNFAALDPIQRARGIKGLSGASKLDQIMWDEFQNNFGPLGTESEQVLHDMFTSDDQLEVDLLKGNAIRLESADFPKAPIGATETTAKVKVRRGQNFFRQVILNAYGKSCCVSGINVPDLLVASHIKPWSEFPSERLNPRNGLCLSSIHDAAFDIGLISIDEHMRVTLSKKLKGFFPQTALEQNFVPFEGKELRMPDKVAEPSQAFLAYHRKKFANL